MNLLLKNTIKKYTNLQLQPTVAVSGGIDSITLSVFISKYLIPNNLNETGTLLLMLRAAKEIHYALLLF